MDLKTTEQCGLDLQVYFVGSGQCAVRDQDPSDKNSTALPPLPHIQFVNFQSLINYSAGNM